ncbi:MAG: hypothetical protein KAH33_07540, partial [Candidatus Delongbacteria bacterium]|nr:hypothetical protein [Candidatus Delongbacteria bacterium]
MNILSFERNTDKKIKIAAYLTLLISFGFAGWIATLVNFSREISKINAFDLGIIWSIKEIPVILGFILALILSFISESRILGIFVAITGLGIVLSGFANYDILGETFYTKFSFDKYTFHMLIITFIFSMGYSYFNIAKDNLVKHSTSSDKTAVFVGKITGFGLVGTISGFSIVSILGFILPFAENPEIKYMIIYLVIGLPLIIGGVLGSQQAEPTKNLKENVQLSFNTKFMRFYLLTFFSSALYYLFIVFGIYQLVFKFKVNLGIIAALFLLQTLLVFFFKRKTVDIVNSKGIALIMQIKYGGALIILLCYAFVPVKILLIILFAIFVSIQLFDSIVKTYMQGISQSNEIRANIVIHDRIVRFSAIIIPVLSGLLWYKMGDNGSMLVFILGGVFALICLVISFVLYPASLFEDNDEQDYQDSDEIHLD